MLPNSNCILTDSVKPFPSINKYEFIGLQHNQRKLLPGQERRGRRAAKLFRRRRDDLGFIPVLVLASQGNRGCPREFVAEGRRATIDHEIDRIAWLRETYGTDSEDQESAYAAALAAATPTTRALAPSASRAAMTPQMPDPWPIGT